MRFQIRFDAALAAAAASRSFPVCLFKRCQKPELLIGQARDMALRYALDKPRPGVAKQPGNKAAKSDPSSISLRKRVERY